MSNPSVILLNSLNSFGSIDDFRIEDNIGESIHIHINNFRFDFTIDEFHEFAKIMNDALNCLDGFDSFKLFGDFTSDVYFATNFRTPVVSIESLDIKSLKFIVRYSVFKRISSIRLVSIEDTPQYKFLVDPLLNSGELHSYHQINLPGYNNIARLHRRLDQNSDYSFTPVVFGENSFLVRDGLHGCACHYFSSANHNVDVIRVNNVNLSRRLVIPLLFTIKKTSYDFIFFFKRFVKRLIFRFYH